MIDVLTLNYNDFVTTKEFVDSVKNYSCVRRVVVVDNKSTDDSFEKLKALECDKVCIIQSGINGGYGAGNNYGIRFLNQHFNSKYILLANPDVIVENSVLEKMEFFLANHDDFAFVAPMMKNPCGILQYNTAMKIPSKLAYILSIDLILSKLMKPFYYKSLGTIQDSVFDVDAVAGSLFLMDADKMLKYGMFDENIFLFCEEYVLGIKMKKAGMKTGLLTRLDYVHNHSVSIKKSYKTLLSRNKLMVKSRLFVLKKYYKAGLFSYSFAKLLSYVYLMEIRLVGFLKRYR